MGSEMCIRDKGYECGIGLEKFNDIKENDVFEAFIMEEYRED